MHEDSFYKGRNLCDFTPVKQEIPLTLNSNQRRKSREIMMKKNYRKRSIPNGTVLPFFSTLEPGFLGLFAN